MPLARLNKKRRVARETVRSLFPRGERGVTAGPAARERHISKATFHQLAMRSPAEVLAHLQD